jgi:hypothetical protein
MAPVEMFRLRLDVHASQAIEKVKLTAACHAVGRGFHQNTRAGQGRPRAMTDPVDRIERRAVSGKQATLEGDGRSFEAIKLERVAAGVPSE